MMPSLPVCVRLPHDVAYGDCGKKTNVPAGTAIDWLTVVNIFSPSALDLVPGEPYESLKVGGLQYFTWGGRTTKNLRINQPLIVVVLCYGGPLFAIPLDELLVHSQTGHHGTDWERHVAILAWEQGKLAEMIEVIQPLVLDGNP